jgi:molybdopterin-containing oxidoreductase family membrane subunit
LIILALIVRKYTKFDPGKEAIQSLGKIVTYCMLINVFFLGLEFFTAFYSQIPGHMHSFVYLYTGLHGHSQLVPVMWLSSILAVIAIALLIFPQIRKNESLLVVACAATFFSLWIDKGFGLVVGGFVPNPFEKITEYWPTLPEALITLAVWAIGFLVLTILYKIAISIKEDVVFDKYGERQIKAE